MIISIPVLGFQRNGGYRVLSELASAWIRAGHKVNFFCPVDDIPYYPTLGKVVYVNKHGLECAKHELPRNIGRFTRLRSLWLALRRVSRSTDIFFANHFLTAYPVLMAPSPAHGKYYYIQAYEPEYFASYHSLKGWLFSLGAALTYHFPFKRIVNSPIYFNYRNLRAEISIPPGVDRSLFHPLKVTRPLPSTEGSNEILIGCIGRAEPEKGTIYVLQAFEKLAANNSRLRIRIAAFAPLPFNWDHEKLEIVVPCSDTELADYYRSIDVLIAPGTVQHGAPHYPVLEAGACGTVVVTTGYLGASDETAWLVSNKSSDSIVAAVESIISNPKEANKRRLRFLEIMDQFNWDTIGNCFISKFISR